jgi:hypothetical protein
MLRSNPCDDWDAGRASPDGACFRDWKTAGTHARLLQSFSTSLAQGENTRHDPQVAMPGTLAFCRSHFVVLSSLLQLEIILDSLQPAPQGSATCCGPTCHRVACSVFTNIIPDDGLTSVASVTPHIRRTHFSNRSATSSCLLPHTIECTRILPEYGGDKKTIYGRGSGQEEHSQKKDKI